MLIGIYLTVGDLAHASMVHGSDSEYTQQVATLKNDDEHG